MNNHKFTVAVVAPKLKVEDGPVDEAGAVGCDVPKVNVEEALAPVLEDGAPKVKLFEDATAAVAVAGLVALAATAPKPPKVGTLSDFVAPKVNPELAAPPLGFVFSSVEVEESAAGFEAAPNVNVDEVLEVVVVEGADDPKENVGGAVGATVAVVDIVNLLGSEKILI